MPTVDPPQGAVALAILVPIYGHVALAIEALWSARRQELGVGLHIVCVVDGDADAGLARLLTSFAAAPDNRCSVYWRRNGGLSAARNSAIAIALRRFPDLEAVFFLDADNRLGPDALGPALRRIQRGEADILYPDLTNFGLRSAQDTAGTFSTAALLRGNYVEAGSVVSARVLRAGVRFDETLREGYEDWAFWLGAARAGFRLAHDGSLGLHYRRRPESMLANTGRNAARLRAVIEAANRDLFSAAGRRRSEARDEPRFALVHVDCDIVEITSDPGRVADRIDATACGRRLHVSRAAPTWTHFPPFVCFAESRTIEALREAGLLPGLLWRLAAEGGGGASCRLVADRGAGVELVRQNGGGPHILMLPRTVLCAAMAAKERRAEGLTRLVMTVPAAFAQSDGVEARAYAIIRTWAGMEIAASASIPWTWRSPVAPRLPVDAPDDRFPHVPDGRRHVGLAHSAVGTARQAAAIRATAAAFAAVGWTPHLLARGAVHSEALAAFETTSLLRAEPKPGKASSPADRTFFGAELDRAVRTPRRSLAAFDWLDAVVVFALKDALSSLGELRGGGTVTVVVLDESGPQSQPVLRRDSDAPYLLAAYEHAIDAFIVPGEADALWLGALGVPRSKIVQDEAGALDQALVAAVARCRATRDRAGKGFA